MSVCSKLCIDDMCRGNCDDTLCGGCYCDRCRNLIVEPGCCEDCAFEDDDEFYDAGEDDTMADGYA